MTFMLKSGSAAIAPSVTISSASLAIGDTNIGSEGTLDFWHVAQSPEVTSPNGLEWLARKNIATPLIEVSRTGVWGRNGMGISTYDRTFSWTGGAGYNPTGTTDNKWFNCFVGFAGADTDDPGGAKIISVGSRFNVEVPALDGTRTLKLYICHQGNATGNVVVKARLDNGAGSVQTHNIPNVGYAENFNVVTITYDANEAGKVLLVTVDMRNNSYGYLRIGAVTLSGAAS